MAAMAIKAQTGFIVWDVEKTAHGPVDLHTLVSWVKDKRVCAETWIFVPKMGVWQRAAQVLELMMFFRPIGNESNHSSANGCVEKGLDPKVLRRLKIFAGMTNEQLERFLDFAEVMRVPHWATIVKQGDRGDAMYLVVEG